MSVVCAETLVCCRIAACSVLHLAMKAPHAGGLFSAISCLFCRSSNQQTEHYRCSLLLHCKEKCMTAEMQSCAGMRYARCHCHSSKVGDVPLSWVGPGQGWVWASAVPSYLPNGGPAVPELHAPLQGNCHPSHPLHTDQQVSMQARLYFAMATEAGCCASDMHTLPLHMLHATSKISGSKAHSLHGPCHQHLNGDAKDSDNAPMQTFRPKKLQKTLLDFERCTEIHMLLSVSR